ncbi:hypothetical protein ACFPOG_12350 [Paenibacillus aestuarii]|uniref:Uncharacterized protein n=1 Tax=Paenibacillus aestuarii TaxID=516965 RepID=A0ABW0K8N5_9BACL
MSGIDFSKYPKAQELMKECNIEDKAENIVWLRYGKSDAAILIAEMHQMCKAGLSDSIPLRNRSKNAANFYYRGVGSYLHVFAKEQARSELGLSNRDVSQIFKHQGIVGGVRHVQMDLESSTNI